MKKLFATIVLFATLVSCSLWQKPPEAPSNLTANLTAPDEKTVVLNWQDNSDNEYGFMVLRNGKTIARATTNKYVDDRTEWAMVYDYSIYSYGKYGKSDAITVTIKTPDEPKPPNKPHFFRSDSVTFDSALLLWNDVEKETEYELYRNSKLLVRLAANTTSYKAVGLVSGMLYEFSLRAVNKYGFSEFVYTRFTTKQKALGQVQGLQAEPDFRSVSLVWRPLEGATSYKVTCDVFQSAFITQETFYEFGGVFAIDSLYTFWVWGMNSDLISDVPAEVTVRTKGRYYAVWKPNTENDLAGYNVYRAANNQFLDFVAKPDTVWNFVVGRDYDVVEDPCLFLTATDSSGNESKPSNTACAEE